MKQNDENKRKYLIIGLCALVVLMAVGFAAFSQQLRINGTANITSNWCLGFDKTKLDTYVASKSGSVGQNPTGSMSYSGSMCGTKSQVNAQLSSHLNQPGDSVEYTLTIINEGTFSATIDNVKVGETFISEDTTFTKGNVLFKVDMPANMTIAAGGSTTMKVKATFQNNTDITGTYSGENQSINVVLNASQGNGGSQGGGSSQSGESGGSQSGGQSSPSSSEVTQIVYAYHTDKKCLTDDCVDYHHFPNTVTDGVADYTQLSSYQQGKKWFFKYGLNASNEIKTAELCAIYDFINTPVCVGDNRYEYYDSIISQFQNLSPTFTANQGECDLDDGANKCTAGGLMIGAYRNNDTFIYDDTTSEQCLFTYSGDGWSYCEIDG